MSKALIWSVKDVRSMRHDCTSALVKFQKIISSVEGVLAEDKFVAPNLGLNQGHLDHRHTR